jgi:hypothetical protein
MKKYCGVDVELHDLTSELDGGISFTLRPLYPRGKSQRYPLNMRLDGSQSRSGRDDEEKKTLSLPGIELRSYSP